MLVVISFNPSTVMVSLHKPKGRWQLAFHSGSREFGGHQVPFPEHVVIPSDTGTLFPPYRKRLYAFGHVLEL